MSHYGLSLKLQVSARLEQKLVITPQLQQAIKLLQLNHVELAEHLEQELLENPTLEVTEEDPEENSEELAIDVANAEDAEKSDKDKEASSEEATAESAEAAAETPEENQEEADPFEDIDWEAYFEDADFKASTIPSNFGDFDPDLPSMESRLASNASLSEHLEWQLRLMRISKNAQNMAMLIIGHLDKHGWLVIEGSEDEDPLRILAEQVGTEERAVRGEQVGTLEERAEYWYGFAEEALRAVHEMEPYGVGARSLSECLLLQCRHIDSIEDPDLVDRLIRDHLPELERRSYNKIGKQIKVSLLELIDAAEVIAQLEPYPSRAFQPEPASYITPDIHIKKSAEGEYTIQLNDDGLPKLKINAYYKQLLKDKDKEKREFIQNKLRDATWLLRSIHQRQRTIYKVTESIIERQRAFFDHGLQHLKPMILRDVAEDIKMHESTISRVTTNKYVHTPQGVFELKFFFTSSLQSARGGEDVSSLTVKEKIRILVAEEDPRSPLSDQHIVKILKGEGIKIARRTVAKYRSLLNIPPSNRRKQLF